MAQVVATLTKRKHGALKRSTLPGMKTMLAVAVLAAALFPASAVAKPPHAQTARLGFVEGVNATVIAARVFADTITPAPVHARTNCWRVDRTHIRCLVTFRAGKLHVRAGSHVRLTSNSRNVKVFLRNVTILDQ